MELIADIDLATGTVYGLFPIFLLEQPKSRCGALQFKCSFYYIILFYHFIRSTGNISAQQDVSMQGSILLNVGCEFHEHHH